MLLKPQQHEVKNLYCVTQTKQRMSCFITSCRVLGQNVHTESLAKVKTWFIVTWEHK